MSRSHYADAAKSARLRKMLGILSRGGYWTTRKLIMLAVLVQGGYWTTRKLIRLTGDCAPHSTIHELRQNGHDIDCRYNGRTATG
jgi:hypothetical protein